jgi:hypothetical protein
MNDNKKPSHTLCDHDPVMLHCTDPVTRNLNHRLDEEHLPTCSYPGSTLDIPATIIRLLRYNVCCESVDKLLK